MRSMRVIVVSALAAAMFMMGAVVLSADGGRSQPDRRGLSGPPQLTESQAVNAGDVDATIARLQERIRTGGAGGLDLARLGGAYLQKARATADPVFYALAERALRKSLSLEASNLPALLWMGELALSRHDFSEALTWGRRARAIDAFSSNALGVIGDALTGLGRYRTGFRAYQRMVDTKPNLSSFARVSYARELSGDIPGAIEAMRRAVVAGALIPENQAWTSNQLGDLLFGSGRIDAAEAQYRAALKRAPDFTRALAGLGRVDAARGRIAAAINKLERVVRRFPLPLYVMTLGDLYEIAGRSSDAQRQYELVVAQNRLFASNGVLPDVEMTVFFADQGRAPRKALALGRTQYGDRKSVQVADAFAWALYRNGDVSRAEQVMKRALRLGTRDAMMHYHAAMIARALGQRRAAIRHMSLALDINPDFSILYSDRAVRVLEELTESS
jgi:tetratricopeptide (TPR) repeat protein